MWVLLSYIICPTYVPTALKVQKKVLRASEIQITDGCEAYGCWKLSLDPCGLDPCEQSKCSYLWAIPPVPSFKTNYRMVQINGGWAEFFFSALT